MQVAPRATEPRFRLQWLGWWTDIYGQYPLRESVPFHYRFDFVRSTFLAKL